MKLTKERKRELKAERKRLIKEFDGIYRTFRFLTAKQKERYEKIAKRIEEIDGILNEMRQDGTDNS